MEKGKGRTLVKLVLEPLLGLDAVLDASPGRPILAPALRSKIMNIVSMNRNTSSERHRAFLKSHS